MKTFIVAQATRAMPLPIAEDTRVNAPVRPRNRALAHLKHCRRSTPVFAATAASGDSLQRKAAAAPPLPPPSSLSSARAAAKCTAAYIILAGFAAITAPLSVGAALFGKGAVAVAGGASASASLFVSSWLVRVLGVLAVTFGVYYAGASLGRGERGFYESTVAGRAALAASFVLLALFGLGDRSGAAVATAAAAQKTPRFGLLLLAAANAVGAASMALALRRDDRKKREEEEEEEAKRKRASDERDW